MFDNKWEAVLNSRLLVNHFKELCIKFSPSYKESSVWANRQNGEYNKIFISFFTQILQLIHEGKADEETFKSEIKKIQKLEILHVEVIWYLEIFKLLTVEDFVKFHEVNKNEDVIEHIAQQIFENLLDNKTNPLEIRTKMISYYLKTGLEGLNSEDLGVSFTQKLMSLIITNLKQYYSCEEDYDVEAHLDIEEFVNNFSDLDCTTLKNFFLTILTDLLESSPQTIKSILKKQESLKSKVEDKKIFKFLKIMSKYCDQSCMMAQLKVKLLETSKSIDWKYMFCFITFIGMYYSEGYKDLKTLINIMIMKSFQTLNSELLLNAFLIARQCCFGNSNLFPSYCQWFSSTFLKGPTKPINSKKTCQFFFDFLTNLSQYDSTYYLKIHVGLAPRVPNECQSILQEYTELVKTQLSDLNIYKELGISENPTTKNVAFDVERVLKHFEKTNNILNSVFITSVFCEEYYKDKFLVELLSKFDGKKSVRHRFILELRELGRIPNSMFKVYRKTSEEYK